MNMKVMEISFDTTPEENDLIDKVVWRAVDDGLILEKDEEDLRMDLEATNANGCPMDFERLAAASERDFKHDVWGIQRYLNRTTGKLEDNFLPRTHKQVYNPGWYPEDEPVNLEELAEWETYDD